LPGDSDTVRAASSSHRLQLNGAAPRWDYVLSLAKAARKNPGPPDLKSAHKPINYNNLQHTINRNNKKRTNLRAAQISS